MAMNLKLDSSGDIIVGRGVSRVEGTEYIAQLTKNKLKTVLGEWELNKKIGIPWFDELLVHNYQLDTIYNWISKTILSTKEVKSLESLILRVDRRERKLFATFRATSTYGGISVTTDVGV